MSVFTYTGWQMGGDKQESLRDIQDFVDVEHSDSDASSDMSDGQPGRRHSLVGVVALVSMAGLGLAFLLYCLSLSDADGHWPLSSATGHSRAAAAFGEKVLIESEPSAPPTTPKLVAPPAAPKPSMPPAAPRPSPMPAMSEPLLPPAAPSAPPTAPPAPPTAPGAARVRAPSPPLGGRAGPPQSPSPAAADRGAAPLRPAADLHDGNVCGDTEELFGGLCYKQCRLLTGGRDAIRTSPWSCCEKHPCTTNQKLGIAPSVACTGFDVAGDGSCPHKPGSCLRDEELFLGVCYKRCSLLTGQEYPHRMAPATCCESSGLSCLDFRKDYTSEEFAVGGGDAGEGTCSKDEELLLGQCFRKCALLTDNEFPLRLAAATCCKAHSRLPHKVGGVWHLGCLDPRDDKTRTAFDTAGDGPHEPAAYADAHYPLRNLTEAGESGAHVHV